MTIPSFAQSLINTQVRAEVDRRAVAFIKAINESYGTEMEGLDAAALLCLAAMVAKGVGVSLELAQHVLTAEWNSLPDEAEIRAAGERGRKELDKP